MENKKQILSMQLNVDDFAPASDSEKESLSVMRESVSFWKDGLRRLRQNPIAMVSLAVLIIVLILAFIVPAFYPYDYATQIRGSENLGPMQYSEAEQAAMAAGEKVFPHILGTDSLGRDYAVRVMMGTRVSLSVGLLASVLVLLIGSVYGSVAGFLGGKVDLFMMRIVDILMSVPSFLIIITLNIYMNAGIRTLVVTIGLFSWMGVARIVRAEVLSLRERDFILASEGLGARKSWVITRHFARNVFSPVLVASTNSIAAAILTESSLSYLGFGISIPNPSWGGMLEGAQTYILTHR